MDNREVLNILSLALRFEGKAHLCELDMLLWKSPEPRLYRRFLRPGRLQSDDKRLRVIRGSCFRADCPAVPPAAFLLCKIIGVAENHTARISTHAPSRGATRPRPAISCFMPYFNSHAPRGARLIALFGYLHRFDFSTHTPLAGRDVTGDLWQKWMNYISTHTPLAGRDILPVFPRNGHNYFNSHAPSCDMLNKICSSGGVLLSSVRFMQIITVSSLSIT